MTTTPTQRRTLVEIAQRIAEEVTGEVEIRFDSYSRLRGEQTTPITTEASLSATLADLATVAASGDLGDSCPPYTLNVFPDPENVETTEVLCDWTLILDDPDLHEPAAVALLLQADVARRALDEARAGFAELARASREHRTGAEQ
jgi:hypothetical protein